MDVPQPVYEWTLFCVCLIAAGALVGATVATRKGITAVDCWARRGGAYGVVIAVFSMVAGAFENFDPARVNSWLAVPVAAAVLPAFVVPGQVAMQTRTRLAAGLALGAWGVELVVALPWLQLLLFGVVLGFGLGAPVAWFAAYRIATGEWWVQQLGPMRILLGVGGLGLVSAAQVILAGPHAVDAVLRVWAPVLGLGAAVAATASAAARKPLRKALPIAVSELRPRKALGVIMVSATHLVTAERRTPLFIVVALLGGATAGCLAIPAIWPLGLVGPYFAALEAARLLFADRDPNLTPKEVEREGETGEWAEPVPLFRGAIHTAMAMLAAALSVTLFEAGAWTYATGMLLCFGVSATFHRFRWPRRAWLILQRLDHAMIFVFIAGAFARIAPATQLGRTISWATAAVAAVGALATVLWQPPRLGVAMNVLYAVLVWAPMLIIMMTSGFAGNEAARVLLLGGAAVYSLGAIVYWLERPQAWPKVFGYHEVYHLFTLIAASLHFVAIYLFLPGAA
jgi:hemolysin III